MREIGPEYLCKILADHKKWIHHTVFLGRRYSFWHEPGKQADLSGADLREADLRGAALSLAPLHGATLRRRIYR